MISLSGTLEIRIRTTFKMAEDCVTAEDIDVEIAADSDPRIQSDKVEPPSGIPRRHVTGVFALLTLVLAFAGVSGAGLIWNLLALACLYAAALSPRSESSTQGRLSLGALVPVGMVVAIFVSTAIALTISLIGIPLNRVYALALLAIIVAIPLGVAWLRADRIMIIRDDGISVLFAGGVGLVGVLVGIVQPLYTWAAAVGSGTDFNRHVILMRQIVLEGGLNYVERDYPRAFHSLMAIVWTASGGERYVDAWMALEAAMWLFFVLILLSLLVVAVRLTSWLGHHGKLALTIAAIVTTAIYVQSMWLTSLFRMGFFTSVGAGLVLMSIVALCTDRAGTAAFRPLSVGVMAIASAVLVNTWVLLAPMLMIPAGIGLVMSLRRKNRASYSRAEWLLSAGLILAAIVASIPPVLSLFLIGRSSDGEISSDLATTGTSGLFMPQLPWVAAGAASLVCFAWLWLRRYRTWVTFSATVLAVGAAITWGVVWISHVPAGLSYYASKLLWTTLVLTIAPAAALSAAVIVAATIWASSRKMSWQRMAATTVVATLLVISAAAILGRISGSPSKIQFVINHGFGGLAVQLPVITYLEEEIEPTDYEQVLVWGLIPESDANSLAAGTVGFYDHLVRESTGWFGLTSFLGDVPIFPSMIQRDSDSACNFLRDYPNALRITGPNPATGAAWLIAAGCPESVVKPSEWVSIPLGDWGYETPLNPDGTTNYQYPTLQEFLDAKTEAQQKTDPSPPAASSESGAVAPSS